MLCIEVLSPEDTYSRTQVKCRDYLAFGVPEVWIVDPGQKTVQVMTNDKITTIDSGSIKFPDARLQIDLPSIFLKPRR